MVFRISPAHISQLHCEKGTDFVRSYIAFISTYCLKMQAIQVAT